MFEDFTDKKEKWQERAQEGKWYVVHTYSGHENKVKVNIEKNTKIHEPIIKLKECVFVLCSAIILVAAILITKFLIFSNLL